MAGELSGTLVIISDDTGAIAGQMEATITYGGTAIDISNKSYADWVELLDGTLSSKQITIAGTIVYNSDAQYQLLRANSWSGTQATYTVTFGATGETLTGKFFAKVESDSAPHGDKVSSPVSFASSGEITRTPQTV